MAEENVNLKNETRSQFLVLGIESSCDETAASVVSNDFRILSNIVGSQFEHHQPYGGVVPELAARAHAQTIDIIVSRAITEAGISFGDLNAVAATGGPGLIGGVLVGATFGKALALANQIPFLAVNHLEGHALTARLTDQLDFPYLLLLVSGGHSQILIVKDVGSYKLLGTTLDDAVGEAFDKIAKLLGIDMPGGPNLEKLALRGDPEKYRFPRPLLGRPDCNFSLSGLKTAVRYKINQLCNISSQDKADISASFQKAVCDVIVDRCANAIDKCQLDLRKSLSFVAAGGVAANKSIRTALQTLSHQKGIQFIAPPISLCTDNAAMIAWAGVERSNKGDFDGFDFLPKPRWPLADI